MASTPFEQLHSKERSRCCQWTSRTVVTLVRLSLT